MSGAAAADHYSAGKPVKTWSLLHATKFIAMPYVEAHILLMNLSIVTHLFCLLQGVSANVFPGALTPVSAIGKFHLNWAS